MEDIIVVEEDIEARACTMCLGRFSRNRIFRPKFKWKKSVGIHAVRLIHIVWIVVISSIAVTKDTKGCGYEEFVIIYNCILFGVSVITFVIYMLFHISIGTRLIIDFLLLGFGCGIIPPLMGCQAFNDILPKKIFIIIFVMLVIGPFLILIVECNAITYDYRKDERKGQSDFRVGSNQSRRSLIRNTMNNLFGNPTRDRVDPISTEEFRSISEKIDHRVAQNRISTERFSNSSNVVQRVLKKTSGKTNRLSDIMEDTEQEENLYELSELETTNHVTESRMEPKEDNATTDV